MLVEYHDVPVILEVEGQQFRVHSASATRAILVGCEGTVAIAFRIGPGRPWDLSPHKPASVASARALLRWGFIK